MIDMEMAEENHVHLGHLRSALPKAQSAASTSINDDTCGAMIPYEIAAGSPLILQLRATRSEHLNRQSRGTAGLRLYGRDVTLRKKYRESKKSYSRQPLPTLEETVDFHFRPPIHPTPSKIAELRTGIRPGFRLPTTSG